jgi:hypothetical protein
MDEHPSEDLGERTSTIASDNRSHAVSSSASRELELAEVRALLTRIRLVTLTGTGAAVRRDWPWRPLRS